MKKQLSTLQQLICVMDPELYRHLGTFRFRTVTTWLTSECREDRVAELVLLFPVCYLSTVGTSCHLRTTIGGF